MQSWIPLRKIEAVVQLELVLLLLALALAAWGIYKMLLHGITPERHRNLRRLFQNLLLHGVYAVALFLAFSASRQVAADTPLSLLTPYFGLAALLWGCTVLVKTARILAFEWLFFSNMQAGVPVLLVNLLTLLLSLLLATWVLSGVFEFHLAPLLATSAIFSIVVGLALQDTLGNLIAGVALQFDKPYELGDWIEVQNGATRWSGQVHEITWRATLLVSMTEEWITIPNRVMAQSEVSNFSARTRPFLRSHIFRVRYGESMAKVRECLLRAVATVPSVRKLPAPLVLVIDASESWIAVKLLYYLDDYGRQVIIGDQVLQAVLDGLSAGGVPLAPPRLELTQGSSGNGEASSKM